MQMPFSAPPGPNGPGGGLPRVFLLLVGATLLTAPPAGTAQELPLLSTEIRLADYGVAGLEEVLRGQLNVEWAEEGPRLTVSRLRERPPAVLPTSVESVPPPTGPEGCFDLGAADLTGMNALGGGFGAYSIGGSAASADLGRDPEGRRVMTFQCDRSGDPSAPCGLWIQLFEPDRAARSYVDTSGLATLSMWVSRRPRGASLRLKAADAAWHRREDALSVGPVDRFTNGGDPEDAWHRVTVPFEAFPDDLARDSLATLVFEAVAPGRTEILVTGIQLCEVEGRPKPLPEPVSLDPPEDAGRKALWIWNTRELLDDAGARNTFLDFVEAGGFDRIFLQLVPERGRSPERGFVPLDGARIGLFLAELRERGALGYAMDGDPRYVLPENHAGVFRTIRAVAEHNRRSPPEERFHGVHYDVEPYLLRGFQGPRRDTILDGFVEVVAGISRIARGSGLEVGVAVPFWLDGVDAYTGELLTAELDGREAPVLDHLLDLVDELAVMDYRTTAEGTNGSVALVLGELEAARRAGVGVWVGVETAPLFDADVVEFGGVPQRGLPPDAGRWIVAEPLAGGETRVWLVPEDGRDRLERHFDGPGQDGRRVFRWPAGPPARVPADSQTFHRLGPERMRTEVGWLLTAIADHPAFLGVAYHHYGTLRALEAEER